MFSALCSRRHLCSFHEEDHAGEELQVRPQRPNRRSNEKSSNGRLVLDLPSVQEHRLHPLQGVHRPSDRQTQDGRVGRANLGHRP